MSSLLNYLSESFKQGNIHFKRNLPFTVPTKQKQFNNLAKITNKHLQLGLNALSCGNLDLGVREYESAYADIQHLLDLYGQRAKELHIPLLRVKDKSDMILEMRTQFQGDASDWLKSLFHEDEYISMNSLNSLAHLIQALLEDDITMIRSVLTT